MKNLVASICKVICYNQSISCPDSGVDFVMLQINNSPLHIRFGLKIVAWLFFILSFAYGLGKPFYSYNSQYKQIIFIEFFESLCKTTRMFISFIRSMSLIYICDNNLL